jgi:hypothetical protein
LLGLQALELFDRLFRDVAANGFGEVLDFAEHVDGIIPPVLGAELREVCVPETSFTGDWSDFFYLGWLRGEGGCLE